MLIKTGSLQHASSTRPSPAEGNVTTNCRKAFIQRKELGMKLHNYSHILQQYFSDAKAIIGKNYFPAKAYKTTAHIYKNAGMFQYLLDLYYEATLDNAADKQFKNLASSLQLGSCTRLLGQSHWYFEQYDGKAGPVYVHQRNPCLPNRRRLGARDLSSR